MAEKNKKIIKQSKIKKNNSSLKKNQKKLVKKFEVMVPLNPKKLVIWLIIGFLIVSFLFSLRGPIPKGEKKLSEILSDAKENKIEKIEVEGDILYAYYKDEDGPFLSRKEAQSSFEEVLKNADIDIKTIDLNIKDQSAAKVVGSILELVLPIIIMAVIFLWIFRKMRGAQDSIFSFGKSKAKLFSKGKQNTSFKDVAGVDEAKKELEEVVDFLKHAKKYEALGARTPKGVLLIGPSGTGKTLLAKAVAGEANVPFFSMAGSEFMEMLVGVGASRTRDLFSTAKKAVPSIIFIDELDAIGRTRGMGMTGGHDEREQTLNQILVEMDGFMPKDNVVVIAATNRPELLDPALVRPGRFDRRIVVDMPDHAGREAILKIHAKGKPFTKQVDWEKVARRTVGFSGADLENMLNESAIEAARRDKKEIDMNDIEEAAIKVKLGPEKKRLQTDLDRKMTAYHEAGHAIVTYMLPKMDKVHRISIVSRGLTLGHTLIPPKRDRLHETKSHLLEMMISLFGGRAAEQLQFKEMTTGAASDIMQATKIAKNMVIEYGMSDLGPISLGSQNDIMDWNRNPFEQNSLSPEMAAKVDKEIKKMVDESYQKAVDILKKSKKKLDEVSVRLIDKETIEDNEFEEIMGENKNK